MRKDTVFIVGHASQFAVATEHTSDNDHLGGLKGFVSLMGFIKFLLAGSSVDKPSQEQAIAYSTRIDFSNG